MLGIIIFPLFRDRSEDKSPSFRLSSSDRVYLFFYFLISGWMGCTGACSKYLRLPDDDSFP
ncbi:hypothetical protein K0F36_18695 [Bacteroides fragilis]|uniref:Uncharacterized protein n=1 Tax=Bacteroides fragilis TaxID=817 RepID=A0AAE6ES22_BACFG|nr:MULTISPECIES: hypothetical protein [Bacteroides]MCE8552144.1 hypothetical protein [Bacteroides fragilis]MCE8629629.1 hypothetical protein [Bacteroides fragilis]MCE8673019.1 hypothetical protein [Bacteroides fragilis]MDK2381042.1 hypothetical protein [Bacteroides fragilis]QCQ44112.1 hypothetical protein EC80_004265 [Bacteroides fragilis]